MEHCLFRCRRFACIRLLFGGLALLRVALPLGGCVACRDASCRFDLVWGVGAMFVTCVVVFAFSISSEFDGSWMWLCPWVALHRVWLGPLWAWPTDDDVSKIPGPGAGCESELFGTVSECPVSGTETEMEERQVSVFQGPGAGFSDRHSSMCENGRVQDLRVASGSCKSSRDEESRLLLFPWHIGRASVPRQQHGQASFLGIRPETFVCWEVLEFLWIFAGLLVSRVWVVAGLTLIQAGKNKLLEFVPIFSQLGQEKEQRHTPQRNSFELDDLQASTEGKTYEFVGFKGKDGHNTDGSLSFIGSDWILLVAERQAWFWPGVPSYPTGKRSRRWRFSGCSVCLGRASGMSARQLR